MTDFMQAEPIIPCIDRWPAATLTPKKTAAYFQQQRDGNISHLKMTQDPETGIIVVSYMSNCPQDWMRQQLSSESSIQTTAQITMEDMT